MAELALLLLILGIVLIIAFGLAGSDGIGHQQGSDLPGLGLRTESPKAELPSKQRTKQSTVPAFGPIKRVVRQPVNKVIFHVLPNGEISSEQVHEEPPKTLRSEKVVGTLTHQRIHIFGQSSFNEKMWVQCKICLEDGETVFSVALDSAGFVHRRCCLRCLFKLGGKEQLDRAIQESERAAEVWRYMQALDQLRSDFPDPTHRPWGEEMLFDAIAFRSLGARGERIVEKILNRRWNDRDLARIEGRPDPGPPTSWTRTFSGTGTIVLSEGERVPVSYKIYLTQEYRDERLCESWISGWVRNPKDQPLGNMYLGKQFILEMPGKRRNKRISLQITKADGTISRCPGVSEGFPDLRE